ncbi:MAG TPA: DUF3662 and FHA domain-containing protein [Mycobacteriales bacterium]|nr:DUF3662 and FHA domain-containing protein [Mycobacteriales bacterium]
MGVLQAFERRLGGLVEGAFARVFKGDVQPVEIAGALTRESDDRRSVVGAGRVLTSNQYVVELSTHDFERFKEWQAELTDELAAMVREHANEAGYSFVGPVVVTFGTPAGVGQGTFRVRSSVVATEGAPSDPGDGGHPGPRPAPPGALPTRPRLIISVGDEESAYFLTHPVTIVGRAAESDLRLDDPGISRRHAELRWADGQLELIDLDSTNGLTVNGVPASRAELRDGDRIDIASTTLIFRRDED